MDRLWQDLRFAVRTLLRTPGLAIVAIATLALGIGANTAVFSLVNTVLLRPLPFADPDRLVMLFERSRATDHGSVSAHEFVAWRRDARSFDAMAMYAYSGFTLTGRGEPITVSARVVTADFFNVLGQRPILGRTFGPLDDAPEAPRLVVLGHAVWMTRFGGDPSVVGKRAMLDDTPFEIIGVVPAGGDMDGDVWVAMNLAAETQKVGKHSNTVIARLARGATIQSAERDVAAAARRLEQEMPDANEGHGVHVASLYEETVGDIRRPFLVALGAVGFVLLIACANVAHVLLTRGAARHKELAIRTAVGATRSQLIRQLVTESFVLSVTGACLGLLLALWVTDLFPSVSAVYIPRLTELRIDWRVLAATAATCVFTCLACGLLPAFRASRPTLNVWRGEWTRTAAAPGHMLAGSLVVSEVAIALVLLVGAGLSVKSFVRLMQVDPGFDPRNVLTVAMPLPGPRYAGAERQRVAVGELVDGLAHAPGVQFAGGTTTLPLGPCCNNMAITVEGKPAPSPGKEPQVRLSITAGRYFEAMRIPLRRGRDFGASDARTAIPLIRWYPEQPLPPRFDEAQPAPVAIISETMARQFWPGEEVLGKRLRVLFSPWVTVIGVVGDVRQTSLTEPPTPQLYLSNLQEPSGSMNLVLRTSAEPTGVAPIVRQRVRALDNALPIGAVQTMDGVVWASVGRPRFNALLLGVSGVIALLLAVIGVYGVIAYSVQRRTHEIGIRRALGARTRDVVRLVLGHALGLVIGGVVVGVLGAVALTRLMATLLYDVGPTDPATFLSVAALITGVALLACYVPSRRATQVDPTDALRAE
jgi:putative ABC transport system permease protein